MSFLLPSLKAEYLTNKNGYIIKDNQSLSFKEFKNLLKEDPSLRNFVINKYQIDPSLLKENLPSKNASIKESDLLNTFSAIFLGNLKENIDQIASGPSSTFCFKDDDRGSTPIPSPGEATTKYESLIIPDTTLLYLEAGESKKITAYAYELEPTGGVYLFKKIKWAAESSEEDFVKIGNFSKIESTSKTFPVEGIKKGKTSIQVGANNSAPVSVHPIYRASIFVEVNGDNNSSSPKIVSMDISGPVIVDNGEIFTITAEYYDSDGVLIDASIKTDQTTLKCAQLISKTTRTFTYKAEYRANCTTAFINLENTIDPSISSYTQIIIRNN